MKKAGIIGIVVVALLVVVGAYALAQNKAAVLGIGDAGNKVYGWRYKMTVSVETPEGLKTGSAVREVSVKFEPRAGYKPHPYHVTTKVKGEAVVVDLGERGVLFALIDPDDYRFVFEAFPGPPGLTLEGAEFYSSLVAGQKNLLEPDPKRNPRLAKFSNKNDYRTISLILPDELSSFYGMGVVLKEISVEISNSPLTQKVDGYLPSYSDESGFGDWFRGLPYGDPRRIGVDSFK
jgi:hypothetical protein